MKLLAILLVFCVMCGVAALALDAQLVASSPRATAVVVGGGPGGLSAAVVLASTKPWLQCNGFRGCLGGECGFV